jgi:hypothetical protein
MRSTSDARSAAVAPDPAKGARDAGSGKQEPPGSAIPQSAGPQPATPAKPRLPKKVVCPVSGTVFNPRTTGGRCPVCGEQVVPEELVAQAAPFVSPAGKWLFQEGGWRLGAVILLVVYQLVIFGLLWHHLADIHAF